jgi:uncharacterized protein (DUF4213/DUF364 family)
MSAEAIVLIIAALGVAAVNVITAWRSDRKTAEVKSEVSVIAGHVNSAATAQVAKVDALTKQVADLTKLLADEKLIAERLAQYAGPARRTRK